MLSYKDAALVFGVTLGVGLCSQFSSFEYLTKASAATAGYLQ
jgi:hypothetical protein